MGGDEDEQEDKHPSEEAHVEALEATEVIEWQKLRS
jgi:hypothetical protein